MSNISLVIYCGHSEMTPQIREMRYFCTIKRTNCERPTGVPVGLSSDRWIIAPLFKSPLGGGKIIIWEKDTHEHTLGKKNKCPIMFHRDKTVHSRLYNTIVRASTCTLMCSVRRLGRKKKQVWDGRSKRRETRGKKHLWWSRGACLTTYLPTRRFLLWTSISGPHDVRARSSGLWRRWFIRRIQLLCIRRQLTSSSLIMKFTHNYKIIIYIDENLKNLSARRQNYCKKRKRFLYCSKY